jgi:hypothetical protein
LISLEYPQPSSSSLLPANIRAALQLAKLYRVREKETARVVEYLKLVIDNPHMCEADIEEAERLLTETVQLSERVEHHSL